MPTPASTTINQASADAGQALLPPRILRRGRW
jgi:hypothetical protein